jgi:stress-induced-phosphoprotein 1
VKSRNCTKRPWLIDSNPKKAKTPEQTLERASKDPEIAEILQDPVMNSILQQAQGNPAALRDHMQNPEVRKKINLLAAAGIIRTR